MLEFNAEELVFIKSLGIDVDFSNLSDDDCINIEFSVGDVLTMEAEANPDRWTKKMRLCEDIIDKLTEE